MDKSVLKKNLEHAFENFKSAIQTHNNINVKRDDGGWSVGQIGEHIIRSTQTPLGSVKKTTRPYDQHSGAIKDLFLDLQVKFPSAPSLQPQSANHSINELFSSLDKNRDKIMTMIDNEDLTDLCVDIQLPVWGALTKYEWLVLFENHIIRHTRQVEQFYSTNI